MKDRFVKVMLVIIAGLLLLNCFKSSDSGGISIPFLETKAKASIPQFVQVGKFINCAGGPSFDQKITKIDVESGWLEVEGVVDGKLKNRWYNTANSTNCELIK